MSDEVEVTGTHKLTRAWVKQELIRELATEKKTQQELANRYGVGQPGIAMFKKRHLVDIERYRDSLDDEWAGIWIANKRNRLAELQNQIEELADQKVTARTAEVIGKLLREAAEELGDITNKNKVEVDVVRYEIVGIDPESFV